MRLTSPVETLDRTFSHVSAASISNCGMRSQNDAELWLIGPRPGDHATSETGTVFVFPATVTCTVSWPVWRPLAGRNEIKLCRTPLTGLRPAREQVPLGIDEGHLDLR